MNETCPHLGFDSARLSRRLSREQRSFFWLLDRFAVIFRGPRFAARCYQHLYSMSASYSPAQARRRPRSAEPRLRVGLSSPLARPVVMPASPLPRVPKFASLKNAAQFLAANPVTPQDFAAILEVSMDDLLAELNGGSSGGSCGLTLMNHRRFPIITLLIFEFVTSSVADCQHDGQVACIGNQGSGIAYACHPPCFRELDKLYIR